MEEIIVRKAQRQVFRIPKKSFRVSAIESQNPKPRQLRNLVGGPPGKHFWLNLFWEVDTRAMHDQ